MQGALFAFPNSSIDGSYGPWAHDFINSETDYGQLLTLGWSAVPVLIGELECDAHTPQRRAHLLALLFSITGENDPRPEGLIRDAPALGRYSMLEQGWSISFNRIGADGGGGSGFTEGPSTRGGALEAEAQAPLIKKWQGFEDLLQVKHRD